MPVKSNKPVMSPQRKRKREREEREKEERRREEKREKKRKKTRAREKRNWMVWGRGVLDGWVSSLAVGSVGCRSVILDSST